MDPAVKDLISLLPYLKNQQTSGGHELVPGSSSRSLNLATDLGNAQYPLELHEELEEQAGDYEEKWSVYLMDGRN